jgi:hypothetical protein
VTDQIQTLTPTRFYLDSVIDEPTPGFSAHARWNGWSCPYFTREQADHVQSLLSAGLTHEEDDVISPYDPVAGGYPVHNANYPDDDYVIGPTVVAGVEYFEIGSHNWTWNETKTCRAEELVPTDFLVDDGFEVTEAPRWSEADACWAVHGVREGHPYDRLFHPGEEVETY